MPLRVHRCEEWRGAVELRLDVGVGAAIEKEHRGIELAIDRGDQERSGPVAPTYEVDVRAVVEENLDRLYVSLPSRMQEWRQTTLCGDANRSANSDTS